MPSISSRGRISSKCEPAHWINNDLSLRDCQSNELISSQFIERLPFAIQTSRASSDHSFLVETIVSEFFDIVFASGEYDFEKLDRGDFDSGWLRNSRSSQVPFPSPAKCLIRFTTWRRQLLVFTMHITLPFSSQSGKFPCHTFHPFSNNVLTWIFNYMVGPIAAAWRRSLGPRLCEVWGPLGLSDYMTHLSVTRVLG